MINAQLKLKPATRKQTYGSGRIGTIHASLDDLKRVLGEPHDCTQEGDWESGDGKVRVEWAFLINGKSDMLFTIYDYKSNYPLVQMKQWSLGGKNIKVKDPLSLILLVE
ncbi:MAG: hypothetical protein NT165_03680 [Candidatus Falkowbacteria bacterium]|nr:hypothetical protein [Candidatus Falkowbacteria bacterium]